MNALTLWDDLFAGRAIVEWNVFCSTLENFYRMNYSQTIPSAVSFERLLWHAIIPQNNKVQKKSFENFLTLFGPYDIALTKAFSNLFDERGVVNEWFHGAIGRDTAMNYLNNNGIGHYLIRYSENKPGLFTMVYVAADGIKNVLIENCGIDGYRLQIEKENFLTLPGSFNVFYNLLIMHCILCTKLHFA